MAATPSKTAVRYPWALRVFLAVSIFFIVVRSALNVGIRHTNWRQELAVYTVPRSLPARHERRAKAEPGAENDGGSSRERLVATGQSVLRYFRPWPSDVTRARLTSFGDWLEYVAVWMHTRSEFLGRWIGVDERWTMFSPSVGTSRRVVRAVLHFEGGQTREVRALTEPEDLASFWRPFAQRRLQYDVNLAHVETVRLGWARALSRSHPHDDAGRPLVEVTLHRVEHPLPAPHEDAVQFWRRRQLHPLSAPAFWRFDVRRGEALLVESTNGESEPRETSGGAD